jgi:hypothetical protein
MDLSSIEILCYPACLSFSILSVPRIRAREKTKERNRSPAGFRFPGIGRFPEFVTYPAIIEIPFRGTSESERGNFPATFHDASPHFLALSITLDSTAAAIPRGSLILVLAIERTTTDFWVGEIRGHSPPLWSRPPMGR